MWAEQGLGDEIMFASCFADAIARVGRCIVDCHPKLESLFRRSFPGASIHGVEQRGDEGAWRSRYEPIDFQIPAGSLPRLFRRRATDFPAHAGYLVPEPARVARWRERLRDPGGRRVLGLSWRGGTAASRAAQRSLELEQLLPLLRLPGIRWISLQYDARADEVAAFAARHGVDLAHFPEAVADYEDTAALACALELTVSVCTALVHLCGALGRPVWVLAPHRPEWRYGAEGGGMIWYPSARLFRQPAPGDWNAVVARAAGALG